MIFKVNRYLFIINLYIEGMLKNQAGHNLKRNTANQRCKVKCTCDMRDNTL